MLPHPTLDKLQTLRLHGMLKAFAEQLKTPDIDSLSFEERLGLLVDRELTERDDKRLSSRLRQARLKHNACLEDIDYRSPRGLDKALILQLSGGQWLRDGLNLIIGGPTGVMNLQDRRQGFPEDAALVRRLVETNAVGDDATYAAYPSGWSQVSNTPYRFYKRTPMAGRPKNRKKS